MDVAIGYARITENVLAVKSGAVPVGAGVLPMVRVPPLQRYLQEGPDDEACAVAVPDAARG